MSATQTQALAPVFASHEAAIAAAGVYAERVSHGVHERDREGSLPVEELADLDRSGLLSITVGREHGGAGLGAVTLAEVARCIAAIDPAIAQAAQGHFLFVDVLTAFGDAEQQRILFADVLSGARIANALAERGGSHAQDLQTRLSPGGRDGSGNAEDLRLNGHKYYATGALTSQWIASTALDQRGALVLAFVERESDGVELDHDWDVMGQRATVSGGVSFADVAVDPRLVLPYGEFFEVPQQFGARAQLYHAAIQVGIAGGALRDAQAYVTTKARPFFEAARSGWAPTASEDPHTIHHFGRLATRVRAAEALLHDTATRLDEIGLTPRDADAAARGSIAVAQLKAFASETAVSVASDIFSLTGASAASRKYDLDRHWRNARTHASHDPVDWKYHHVGNFLLNGTLPPNHGQL